MSWPEAIFYSVVVVSIAAVFGIAAWRGYRVEVEFDHPQDREANGGG